MPHYEFCNACRKTFSKILTIAEYDKGKNALSALRKSRRRTSWSAFSAVISQKSA